jgi:transposase
MLGFDLGVIGRLPKPDLKVTRDRHDRSNVLHWSRMALGKRKRHAKQASMWVATQHLPRSAGHPFYARLNQLLDQHDFDGYVEGRCAHFYADDGRPGLAPGRYFRLLLIGYFEGLDAERAIAWRAADSFALREFLGLV